MAISPESRWKIAIAGGSIGGLSAGVALDTASTCRSTSAIQAR